MVPDRRHSHNQYRGFICITDRTKDPIKSREEWISSAALENALLAHEHIREAAVGASPISNAPWQSLCSSKPREMSLANIRQQLASRFPCFRFPDAFAMVPEIPETSAGKYDKKVIRPQVRDGHLAICQALRS